MNEQLKDKLALLFLVSLLFLIALWGARLLGWIEGGPKENVINARLFVAAPGGGLKEGYVDVLESQYNAESLWEKLKEASENMQESLLPSEARLLAVREEDTILVASFSADLAGKRYLGSNEEISLVYSIVNTLSELPQIESVHILIEGMIIESLGDHVDLTTPLPPDFSIVQE